MQSKIFLYQICYQDDHLESIDPDLMVLENRKNLRPDWREYWPIRNYLLEVDMEEDGYYGFLSPKFSNKTGLAGSDVKLFVNSKAGVDVFTFSPQADMGAFFFNVFEQGETFDPGFLQITQELMTQLGYSVDLKSLVMDSRHVVFSNFIVAKPVFWREWLALCERIFELAESGCSDLANGINAPTSYPGGVPRKVFIIERMASFMLTSGRWECAPYSTYQCAWSALPTSQFKQEAISSDALKMAYNETLNDDFLSTFSALRDRLFFATKPVTQCVSGEQLRVVKDDMLQIPSEFSQIKSHGVSSASNTTMNKTGKIAIASIQRNRNKYILEWLAFHMAVGFNQFYIYCHKTTDGMQKTLFDLSKKYPIDVFILEMDDFPQLIAYQHAWENFGEQVDWMAFIDGDEFLFPTKDDSIQAALSGYDQKELSALGVYWKCYGSNGHVVDPDGLILETHSRHSNNDFLPNRHIKSILRGGEKIFHYRSHLFDTERGTFDELMRPISHGWMKDLAPSYEVFRINHYVVQSRQFYFEVKREMGGADLQAGFVRSDAYFDEYDRNEDSDGMQQRFIDLTKNKMAKLSSSLSICGSSSTSMKQTPAHTVVNTDLLGLMPSNVRRIVEVGCMHGSMARACRELYPSVHYFGIDIDPEYAQVAAEFCDQTLGVDIESMAGSAFQALFPSDCWVFGDCLEHLRDPWRIMRMVRESIDPDGCMLICIPNAQHWSVQMRLATGQFRYEDSGLLDRTHLRWFTRTTLLEMFSETGWRIEHGFSRQLPTQPPAGLLDGIQATAMAAGAESEQAVADAMAFQYLFRLRPDNG